MTAHPAREAPESLRASGVSNKPSSQDRCGAARPIDGLVKHDGKIVPPIAVDEPATRRFVLRVGSARGGTAA
jgi:hypothetical protein